MKPLLALVVVGLLGLAAVTALAVRRNALYDASGPSRIEADFRRELALIDAVDSGELGNDGAPPAFGQLVSRIHGRYPLVEVVKLAKSSDPIKAMLGLELLACDGHLDYLTRHLGDQRPIRYIASRTHEIRGSIGNVLADHYEVADYAQRHRLQLDLFKVVLIDWS